ncbi:MAG TPA: ATP-binding protein [Opitutaceae bacterium]|nr:ATP-binding protein [Opitutaceae bacterium]
MNFSRRRRRLLPQLLLRFGVVTGVCCAPGASGETTTSTPLHSVSAIRQVGEWNPRVAHPLDFQATVTAVDEERKLIVVEDDRAAIALALESLPAGITAGQRIALTAPDSAPALPSLAHFPLAPSRTEYLRALEIPENSGTVYVARIRGFIVPPATGQYRFWIASDDSSELWLGHDEDPLSARVIASVPTWTMPKDWAHFPEQHSDQVRLEAGHRYYIEILHGQRGGDDHLSVSWQGPGLAQQIVADPFLMPWRDESGATESNTTALPSRGVLREVWSNSVISNVSVLMAPRRLETALMPYHPRITIGAGDGFPTARELRPGGKLAPADEFGWCEMEGTVEFVGRRGKTIVLELSDGDQRSQVVVPQWDDPSPERLLGQRVKAAGVAEAATDANGARIVATVRSPGPTSVTVLGQWGHSQAYPLLTVASLLSDDGSIHRNLPARIRGRIASVDDRSLVIADEGSITAYISEDGAQWHRLGPPVEVPMSHNLQTGLVLSSHSPNKSERAVFDRVQGPAAPLKLTPVGAPTTASNLQGKDGVYTLVGGGRDMWSSPDQFSFAHAEMVGAGTIIVRLAEFAPREEWAKAGIMMRAGTDADAPFVALVQTGAHGCCLQWRPPGYASIPLSISESHRNGPVWLKLERRFDSIRVTSKHPVEFAVGTPVEVVGFVDDSAGQVALTEAVFRLAPSKVDNANEIPIAGPLVEIGRVRSESPGSSLTPFRIGGVVTFADFVQGRRYFSVQDQTGAVFIGGQSAVLTAATRVGQRVEIQFDPLPSRTTPRLSGQLTAVLGPGTLPKPLRHPAENALQREGEAHWVEVDAIARTVLGPEALQVRASDAVFNVLVPHAPADALQRFIDARIKVRGVVGPPEPIRTLLVPDLTKIEVTEEAVAEAKLQAIPVATVARNVAGSGPLHRTKIIGTVTFVEGTTCFVQDPYAGARVEMTTAIPLRVGDSVSAIGFPDLAEDESLVLSHASVHTLPDSLRPNGPTAATVNDLLSGTCGAKLVTVRAVVSRVHTTQIGHTLELQIDHRICRATLDSAAVLPSLPSGTIVNLTGVCTLETALPDWIKVSASSASILSVKLLLRDSSDIVVLQKPPGWAVKRTLLICSIVALVLGLAGIWINILRRRVAQRTADLNAAMKQLREETQTSATLTERNRLAGEIHDSIEQGFSGVIFQLETTAKRSTCPPEIRAGITLARNMVAFSRQEVRHAVWNLHSPLLDNADLSLALRSIASHLESDALQITVSVEGTARRLGSTVEHHVLRVAQEAIANAAKHARAQHADVRLTFEDSFVSLSVRDDGCGFDPANVLGRAAGHFGLRSLRGRAAKVHGELTIESTVGKGTTVSLRVPLANDLAS